MNFRALLHSLSGRPQPGTRGFLAPMIAQAPRADSWTDSATPMRKYRRHRAVRNAMAKASRRRNQG